MRINNQLKKEKISRTIAYFLFWSTSINWKANKIHSHMTLHLIFYVFICKQIVINVLDANNSIFLLSSTSRPSLHSQPVTWFFLLKNKHLLCLSVRLRTIFLFFFFLFLLKNILKRSFDYPTLNSFLVIKI